MAAEFQYKIKSLSSAKPKYLLNNHGWAKKRSPQSMMSVVKQEFAVEYEEVHILFTAIDFRQTEGQ